MKKTLFFVFLLSLLGSNCKNDPLTDTRDNFIATYNVSESWSENNITQTNPDFTILVTKSAVDDNKILLSNFGNYGLGVTVFAIVSGSDLVIPKQTLPNNRVIQGTGSQTNLTLTFVYTESFNNYSVTIKVVAQKL